MNEHLRVYSPDQLPTATHYLLVIRSKTWVEIVPGTKDELEKVKAYLEASPVFKPRRLRIREGRPLFSPRKTYVSTSQWSMTGRQGRNRV